ncbi:MAG: DUF2797 domain-containing protein [Methanobacteriota archaeon]|nr:MAG: DUF2797 domain-containing protein [Euryarchaeota archaeon]
MEKFVKTLRGYSYFVEKSNLKLVLWLETFWGAYRPVDALSIKRIEVGEYICKVCNNYSDHLEQGYCQDCFQTDETHQIWLNCLYNRPDSFINTIGCSKKDPSCGIPEHVPKCFTRYLLYLGRIGDIIKVGITRKNRLGGLWGRFIEQGLNEALVVDSLENLPVASDAERWFKELGFGDSIRYAEKVEQLSRQGKPLEIGNLIPVAFENGLSTSLFDTGLYVPRLLDSFPLHLWNERFPNSDLKHLLVFPDAGFPDLDLSEFSVRGKIVWFQGSMLVSSLKGRNYITNMEDLLHREIIDFRRF